MKSRQVSGMAVGVAAIDCVSLVSTRDVLAIFRREELSLSTLVPYVRMMTHDPDTGINVFGQNETASQQPTAGRVDNNTAKMLRGHEPPCHASIRRLNALQASITSMTIANHNPLGRYIKDQTGPQPPKSKDR